MKTALLTLAACVVSVALADSASAQSVNGRNVVKVDYRGGNFRQVRAGSWRESSGANFREQGRDQWSVYLFDSSRNVYIQLDLYTKRVKYRAGASGPYVNLYTIVNAFAPPPAPLPRPRRLTLTNAGVDQFGRTNITWNADRNATSYELQIYVQGQLQNTLRLPGGRSSHLLNLNQLKRAAGIPAGEVVTFGFHIRGKNRTGAGVWSQALMINQ